jgi:hypothetical protein
MRYLNNKTPIAALIDIFAAVVSWQQYFRQGAPTKYAHRVNRATQFIAENDQLYLDRQRPKPQPNLTLPRAGLA